MSEKDIAGFGRYLEEVLGLRLALSTYQAVDELPYALRDAYSFHQADLLSRRFLLLRPLEPEPSPATLEKQLRWLEEKTGQQGVVGFDALSAQARRRLIERRVPFIVPGNQLYLPDLAIDLREAMRAPSRKPRHLSPASQVLVLAACLRRLPDEGILSPTSLADLFGYSKMTFSRSMEEMSQLGLIESGGEGKAAPRRFVCSGRDLWEKARPYLRSPVRRRIYLRDWPGGAEAKLAGEAALARQTSLAFPRREIRAIGSAEWKIAQGNLRLHLLSEAAREMAGLELEIWSYSPSHLSSGPDVDPLSLALSLTDETDDRVQIAVEELLRTSL